LVIGPDAIAEPGEALGEFGPERETLADGNNVGVDRPEACDMLVLHFGGHAPGLHQAGLKPSALLSEANEHGVVA
jgi:hypothetical protein